MHTHEGIRRFRVHAHHVNVHEARMVEEVSFEAAAVAYLEKHDISTSVGDDKEISVLVREVGTGHEHCFKLDLETGETVPCE